MRIFLLLLAALLASAPIASAQNVLTNPCTGDVCFGTGGPRDAFLAVDGVKRLKLSFLGTQLDPLVDDSLSLGTSTRRFKNAVFSGDITAVTFTGDLTGNITGDITGNVTGNLTGDVTGNVTGDVVGDVEATTLSATTARLMSSTAPTIASDFGTDAAIAAANGTAAFTVNVGTGGTATSGVLTLPAATTGWICHVENRTAVAANVADARTVQIAATTTTVTVENQTISTGAALAWTASDVLVLSCWAH